MKLESIIAAASLMLYSATSWGAVAVLKYSKIGTSVTGKPILICIFQLGGKTIRKAIPATAGKCPSKIEIY